MKQGIDVSRYQGTVNWPQVAASGISFAIPRAGYGRLISQEDPTFARNYEGARAAGLSVGCYWYSYATDVSGAIAEAQTCLRVVDGREMPMGIWFDQEYEPGILALTNTQRTEIVETFLRQIRAAGYIAGLYCSADWLRSQLITSRFENENLWVAQYASVYTGPLLPNIWQYTDQGRVNGISGYVDRNRLYACPTEPSGPQPMPDLGTASLRLGSRGQYVANLQLVLAELGYAPGTIDGIFGARTEAAVRAFQRAAGLSVDGIVGRLTRAALTEAWNAQQ